MGVEIKKFLRTKDRFGNEVLVQNDSPMDVYLEGITETGDKVFVNKTAPCTQEARVRFVCDGPSCAGPDGQGPTRISWGETPGEAPPKSAAGILDLGTYDGHRYLFCGGGCLIDFIHKRKHVVAPPPEEKPKVLNISEHKPKTDVGTK